MRIKATQSGSTADVGSIVWLGTEDSTLWFGVDRGDEEAPPRGEFSCVLKDHRDEEKKLSGSGRVGELGFAQIPKDANFSKLVVTFTTDQAEGATLPIERTLHVLPSRRRVLAACVWVAVLLVMTSVAWCVLLVLEQQLVELGSMASTAITSIGGGLLGFLGLRWKGVYRWLLRPAWWAVGILLTFAAVGLTRVLIVAVENGSSESLSIVSDTPLLPGQATLVQRSVFETWSKNAPEILCSREPCEWCGFKTKPEQCESVNEVSGIVHRAWRVLVGAPFGIGCIKPNVHESFVASWKKQRSCQPKDEAVREAWPPEQKDDKKDENQKKDETKAKAPRKAELVLRPFRSGAVGTAEDQFTIDLCGSGKGRDGAAKIASRLTMTGEGLVESVIVDDLTADKVPTPIPLTTGGIGNSSVVLTLRGTIELGELRVGRLGCTVEGLTSQSFGKLFFTRAPTRAAGWIVRSAGDASAKARSFSAFDLEKPELSQELFFCLSTTTTAYDVELTLDDGFKPLEWTLELPSEPELAAAHPAGVDVYLGKGRYWGRATCPGRVTKGHRYRLAAQKLTNLPGGPPLSVSDPAEKRWRRELEGDDRKDWFWICGLLKEDWTPLDSEPPLSAVLPSETAARRLMRTKSDDGQLKDSYEVQPHALRQCFIDELSDDVLERPPSNAKEKCKDPATAKYLEDHHLDEICSSASKLCAR